MFLIEKNVPLAPKATGKAPRVAKPSKYPFAYMAVGDSFFWKGAKQTTVAGLAGNVARTAKDGRKFVTRTDKDAGGIRCWRVA